MINERVHENQRGTQEAIAQTGIEGGRFQTF
jgi:hypothetical protein